MENLDAKYDALAARLAGWGSLLLAYSGGVDSTLLLRTALDAMGRDRVHPALAVSPLLPAEDRDRAGALCRTLGAVLLEVPVDWAADEAVARNEPDRCYRCKARILATLEGAGRRLGVDALVEGTVEDDALDHRPGARALSASAFASPLAEARLGKEDVRALSRRLGLPTWDLPSNACLATRIPFGEALTEEGLRRVDRAEEALRKQGYRLVRVRSHGPVARIEVAPEDVARLAAARDAAVRPLKKLGFRYVTVDLEGYRTGSLNPPPHSGKGAP